jgi:DNA modification methylase
VTRPWSIHVGDCRHTLAAMPEESIDAVVTDTPYGLSTLLDPPNLDREALWQKLTAGQREAPIRTLMRSWLDTDENPVMKGRGFMGKEWDALVPPPATWRKVWRVLKPGAYCLAFAGTRTYALITMAMHFADFEIEDTWQWLYGQGMPKRVRLDLKIDEHFGMKDARPVLGKHPNPAANNDTNAARFNASHGEALIHGAAHPDAARFVGWDRASRPGWEPIIVAVKPLRGTIAETALRYGTGGMNADGCRIPRDASNMSTPQSNPDNRTRGRVAAPMSGNAETYGAAQVASIERLKSMGGYPANVIIDEEVAAELDRLTGPCGGAGRASGPAINGARDGTAAYGARGGIPAERVVFHGRCDGASNFFYTAKASTSERDKGLEDLPTLTPGERSGGREEGSAGINGYAGTRGENGRNPHPTVKPISLMRYLVRRASPPGAWDPDMAKRPVVLDCFMGSGSTGVAAMVEGVRFVGCELGEESAEVARLRLQHAYALPREDGEAPVVTRVGGQGKLF